MRHGKLKGYLAGYLPLNVIQALVSLGVVVIYSRLLAPDQYGRYALAVIAMQWLQSLLYAWLHGGVARFYEGNRARGQLPAFLTTTWAAALGVSGLLVLAGGLALAFSTDPWRGPLLAGLVGLIARSLLLLGLEGYRAGRDVGRYTRLEITHYILGLGLGTLLVIATTANAAAALWGTAIASLVVLLWDAPRQLRLVRPPAWSGDAFRRLARYGLPLASSALLSQILVNSDRFFIAWLLDEKAVGLYSVAYALADRPAAIFFNWIAMAALPLAFVAMERDGPAAARQVMASTGQTLLLVMLPCTAGIAAVATPLAAVVVGVEFRDQAAQLIPWIALASLLFGFTAHYTTHAFLITENTRLLLVSNLLLLALYITLNLLLIPPFALPGAVAASIITYALAIPLQVLLARRFSFSIPLLGGQLLRALLACGVMVLVLRATAFPATLTGLAFSIGLGSVAYAVSALVFNVAGSRSWLRERWRRPSRRAVLP